MYLRKLPSGLWQATVRHPSGKRITKTDPLKRVVAEWGRDLEAQFARGDMRDPRAGRITVGEWYERWITARGIEAVTRAKLASVWRTHCATWATWPMDSVTHLEAQEWVRRLETTKRADGKVLAAATVHTAVHLMSSLYAAALAERPPIVLGSPFAGLDKPTVPPSPIVYYTHDEADALLGALEAMRHPQWRVLVEVGLWVGLRPGELFGLHGDRVDWFRGRVEVTRVMTRYGLREYPKSRRSHRTVPVRGETLERMSALMVGRARTDLVFTAPEGGTIRDETFRHRVWYPAVRAAGVPEYPPRAMRHTAASWLVQDGVDLYRVQKLLGHESFQTTTKYAHLSPDEDDVVRESWRRMGDAQTSGSKKASGSK